MKINSNVVPANIASTETRGVAKKESEQTQAVSQPASTKFTPSNAADSSQDINTARVDEIKQAIREGRFEVNAGKIADGLIASAQELVSEK